MLLYLGWDTYYMITKPILFRVDLMIHHSMAFFTYATFTHICPLQMSNLLVMECISLMNNILRNNKFLLAPSAVKPYENCNHHPFHSIRMFSNFDSGPLPLPIYEHLEAVGFVGRNKFF